MADLDALTAIIEPECAALGFDLVRVVFIGSGDEPTLQIMAERPDTGQLHIDDCAALSRAISAQLDALEEAGRDPIEGAYRLEVSSPGIDRPLTRAKDFAAWAGHEAKLDLITPIDGRKALRGLLGGLDGEIVTIADRKTGTTKTALGNIAGAKLILTDALIAATMPLSADGAEEFLTEEQED
ncbi:MAG: ribosome maturation protein RimP [Parasphingorhabdus sp.]|nr:ribosome maturation protein RimP [Parasphingorhabdus sp.]